MHKFGNCTASSPSTSPSGNAIVTQTTPPPPPPPSPEFPGPLDPTPLQFPIPSIYGGGGGYGYLLKPQIRHKSECRQDHPHKFSAFDICLSQRNLWFHKISILHRSEGIGNSREGGGIVLKQCMMLNWNFQRGGMVIGQIPSEWGYGYFMEPHNHPLC